MGIEVVIMKKLCKQEVIGIRMYQFKVSGLNSVQKVEIGIANFKCTLFKPFTLN